MLYIALQRYLQYCSVICVLCFVYCTNINKKPSCR